MDGLYSQIAQGFNPGAGLVQSELLKQKMAESAADRQLQQRQLGLKERALGIEEQQLQATQAEKMRENMIKGVTWAQTPDQWQQLVSHYESQGVPIPQQFKNVTPENFGETKRQAYIALMSPESAYKAQYPEADSTKPTTLMQNLQAAGLKPGTPEYQKAIIAATTKPLATATATTGGSAADEKLYETMGKGVEGRIGEYRASAKGATDLLSQVNRFSMAMERLGKTGQAEERKKQIRAYASSWGFPIDEAQLASAQGVDQAAKTMIAEQLRLNKGPQTDFDAEFTGEFMPSLKTTTEANKGAISYMRSTNKLKQLFGQLANQAYSAQGFDQINAKLQEVDNYAMSAPSVIKAPNGAWVMFNDFYNAKKRKGVGTKQILDSWLSVADEARQ